MFFSFMLKSKSQQKVKSLVKWALPGEIIPMTCIRCGTSWTAPNISPLQVDKIQYGKNYSSCRGCERIHSTANLEAGKRAYIRGDY